MQPNEVRELAGRLLDGRVQLDDFVNTLSQPKSSQFGDVTLDLDRARRCGFPEVVYGEGKSVETMQQIFRRLLDEHVQVLATRVSAEKAQRLLEEFPRGRYSC